MALSPNAVTPILASAGIAWMYYRRIRNSFGRQPWRPRRTAFRMAFLGLVMLLLLSAAIFVPHVAPGIAAGVALGFGLGLLGLRHTDVAFVDGIRTFHPNPWIGATLSTLLIGRLVWRLFFLRSAAVAGCAAWTSQDASPLTMAIAATLISYYLTNGIGLALRMRALPPVAPPQKESAGP